MTDFDQMCMAARYAFDSADGNDVTSAVFGTDGIRVVLHKSERIGASLHLEITVGNRVQTANISRGSAAYLIAAALIEAADAMSECNRRIREASVPAPEKYMPPPLSKPEEHLTRAEDDPYALSFPAGTVIYRLVDNGDHFRTIEEMIAHTILRANGPAIHVERTIAGTEAPIERVWMALTEDPPLKSGDPPRRKFSWGDTEDEAMRFAKAGRKGH